MNTITIVRTSSDNADFRALVKLLDEDLARRDGKDHSFYSQYNKIVNIQHVVVAYENKIPCGCGAIKQFDNESMEVKRMFVLPELRGRGIASKVLKDLEKWAHELSFSKCVLETGKRQPEAISLYTKNGYGQIENYGQYIGIENSVCFAKNLS